MQVPESVLVVLVLTRSRIQVRLPPSCVNRENVRRTPVLEPEARLIIGTIKGGNPMSRDSGSPEIGPLLAQASWGQSLSEADASVLANLGEVRANRRGTYLFQQGDEAIDVFVVVRGRVELTSSTADGVERLHSILRPGNPLGVPELLTESTRRTTALVAEDSTLWRCRREPFIEFVEDHPRLLKALLADTVRRMQALDDMIQDLTSLALKGRVAKALLALALPSEGGPIPRRTASIAAQPISPSTKTIEIKQADLAKLCGATRENVGRALTDLQRKGAIARREHSYELLNPLYLRRLAHLS
jgi:CRP/FNR family transcriptional regulator, cyclic AMP receptor protein